MGAAMANLVILAHLQFIAQGGFSEGGKERGKGAEGSDDKAQERRGRMTSKL